MAFFIQEIQSRLSFRSDDHHDPRRSFTVSQDYRGRLSARLADEHPLRLLAAGFFPLPDQLDFFRPVGRLVDLVLKHFVIAFQPSIKKSQTRFHRAIAFVVSDSELLVAAEAIHGEMHPGIGFAILVELAIEYKPTVFIALGIVKDHSRPRGTRTLGFLAVGDRIGNPEAIGNHQFFFAVGYDDIDSFDIDCSSIVSRALFARLVNTYSQKTRVLRQKSIILGELRLTFRERTGFDQRVEEKAVLQKGGKNFR